MADGEEQRNLAVGLKDTITGVVKDSSGKMAEFHEDTAAIGEQTSQALVDQDANIAGDLAKVHPDEQAPQIPEQEAPPAASPVDDAAAKETADKAAQEAAARRAEKAAVPKQIGELRTQGHAPARHLDPSEKQLNDRLGKPIMEGDPPTPKMTPDGYVMTTQKVDPARPGAGGLPDTDPLKYKDMYRTKPNGQPANHSCGPFATAFGDPESMAKADAAARAAIPAGAGTHELVTIDAAGAIGPEGMGNLRGKYIDPSNPLTGTNINYKDVDFTGTKITAVYDKAPDGSWNLTTIYPEPDRSINQ
ncbi:hypothetical protein [Actinospica robiniae]|uniref:hypothetical protein n=1 Tax=Actinospica robiniae TaxID=304901 RepID=UPI0003F66ACC|nr:hypothetical protein [Actinospica robiniae]